MRFLPALIAAAFVIFPTAPYALATTADVTIEDGAGILSPAEESQLSADTASVNLPESVARIHYVTFSSNDDNLNDTVRFYTADHGMQSADGEKFADGLLIVSVGMDPRRMAVSAGEDVNADLHINDQGRADAIIGEMKPLLADAKYAQGMLRGVQAAADTDLVAATGSGDSDGQVAGILGGTAVVLGAGGVALAVRASRKKKTAQARADYDYILAHHGDVAGRLEAIDVRAHSLSSPLANDKLRRQWQDIRDKFLDAHTQMGRLGEISSASADSEFRTRASELKAARAAVEEVVNAEANLNRLADMEHGDADVRRAELTVLHEDILEAIAKSEGELTNQLKGIDSRVLALRDDASRPAFMDEFATILGDYEVLIGALKDTMYEKSQVQATEHEAVTLGSRNWHPGYGYYVPFYMVNNWHNSDVSAASSSSSANTGFSSPGFSGASASGSF